jgi:cell division ATPase FtsA
MDELPAAVRFQAMKELPFPLDEAQIDFVVLERDAANNATSVLLAAVRSETLERLKATCTAAGLHLERVGLRPYGNLISTRFLPGMGERRVLFVDVGPAMSEINVFRAGTLAFSRSASVSVPFASGELLADESRVSSKKELGELLRADEFETDAIEELLVEITRTIQAYRATEGSSVIDQILIAGGTGCEPALAVAVERRFNLPTALFDPSGFVTVGRDDAIKLRAFSSVLGLACTLARSDRLELDFLNPKRPIPKGRSLKRRVRAYGIAAAVVLAVGIGWTVREFTRLNAAIAELNKDVDPTSGQLTRSVRDMVETDLRAEEVKDWQQESRQMVWLDHLLNLTRLAVDPGKQMLASDIDLSGNAVVTMKVAATSMDVAIRFVEQLNGYEREGRHPYRASLGVWVDSPTSDGKFKGRVDVRIELLELKTYTDPKRLKEREQMQKKLLNV